MGVWIPTNCKWLRRSGWYRCACPSRQRRGWTRFLFGVRRGCVLAVNFYRDPEDHAKCAYEEPHPRPAPPQAWRGKSARP